MCISAIPAEYRPKIFAYRADTLACTWGEPCQPSCQANSLAMLKGIYVMGGSDTFFTKTLPGRTHDPAHRELSTGFTYPFIQGRLG